MVGIDFFRQWNHQEPERHHCWACGKESAPPEKECRYCHALFQLLTFIIDENGNAINVPDEKG